MKVKINKVSGHKATLVFRDAASCSTKDPLRAVATIDESGNLNFIDEKFEKKVTALSAISPVGFSRYKHGDIPIDGYVYLTSDKAEYSISNEISESLVESVNESIEHSDIPEDIISSLLEANAESTILDNIVDLKANKKYLFHDELEEVDAELLPIYASKKAILEQDKEKVIGFVDSINKAYALTDKDIVLRINEAVEAPIFTEIGISKMALREGYYLDFVAPDFRITKFEEVEIEDEDGDIDYGIAHFLADEFVESAPEKRVQADVEVNEAVVADDIVNKNPEVLGKTGPAPAQRAIYDEDPDKIYKQPAIEAAAAKAAKDKADFEARMKSYLAYALK